MEGAQTEAKEPARKLLQIGRTQGGPFAVDANLIATGRTCVVGSSGSGKSYAVAVICEELCRMDVPFAIIDTEGEYSGLKEKYKAILVSDDQGSDLAWEGLDIDELARQAPDIDPLILDFSDLENPKEKVARFLEPLYKTLTERRTPYLVVVEEADRFIPQAGERVPIFGEISRRGRKRGMGLMVCTQRPSLVDKNTLSQCGNQLIGRLVIQNDLQSVSQFFSGRGMPKQLTNMQPGVFYAMGGLSDPPVQVEIRRRNTVHGGTTPKLGDRVVKPFMGTLAASPQRTGDRKELAETEPKVLGFDVRVPEVDATLRVRRAKSHVFFGEEETVASLTLRWRPLVLVTLLQRRGLLVKKFQTRFLLLDGVTGAVVELGDRLTFSAGFEMFRGLDQQEVAVMKTLDPDSFSSVIDLEGRLGMTRATIKRALKGLEEVKLVSSTAAGKAKMYRRLAEMPSIKLLDSKPVMQELVSSGKKTDEVKLDEELTREVVKGLWEKTDAVEFAPVVYPMYRAELVRKKTSRVIWIDGLTGKQLELPSRGRWGAR